MCYKAILDLTTCLQRVVRRRLHDTHASSIPADGRAARQSHCGENASDSHCFDVVCCGPAHEKFAGDTPATTEEKPCFTWSSSSSKKVLRRRFIGVLARKDE